MGFTLMDKSDQDRPRYSHVHPGSDLDIAIVSTRLFNEYWDLVHGLQFLRTPYVKLPIAALR